MACAILCTLGSLRLEDRNIQEIFFEGALYTNPADMANLLKKNFTSISNNLDNQLPFSDVSPYTYMLDLTAGQILYLVP